MILLEKFRIRKKMKHQQGFTLIELVVVIVILSILAVVAAPRFLNLQSEARIASVQGLTGALNSGASLVHSKAAVDGLDTGNAELDVNGDGTEDISLRAGYPRVKSDCANFIEDMGYWVSLDFSLSCNTDDDSDWYGYASQNIFYFLPSGFSSIDEQCYVTYTTASEYDSTSGTWVDTSSATIISTTDGC